MAKTNRCINIDEISDVLNVSIGTTNYKSPKVLFLNIKSWLTLGDGVDYESFFESLDKSVRERAKGYFGGDSICDQYISLDDVKEGKTKFYSYEVTFLQSGNVETVEECSSKYLSKMRSLSSYIEKQLCDASISMSKKKKK